MSSILDDILNAMEKPPIPTEDQRRRAKEATDKINLIKQQEKDELNNFKKRVQESIRQFISNTEVEYFAFEALERAYRNIIYDVAEVAGVMACSYGLDEVDRYTVVYRKESGPTEDERTVRNSGGKWNAEVCEEMKKKRMADTLSNVEETGGDGDKKKTQVVPLTGPDYRVKYSHISITPQKTSTNSNYGEVPSSLKRDMRSIEQTLSDLKAKRLKTNVAETSEVDACVPQSSSQHVDVDKPCPGGSASIRILRRNRSVVDTNPDHSSTTTDGEGMYDISENGLPLNGNTVQSSDKVSGSCR